MVQLSFSALADFEAERIAARAPAGGHRLDEVLRAPALRALEASWRSLAFLVERCASESGVVVDVLDCARENLEDDVDDAAEVARSGLFHKVYSEVWTTRGATPFGLLVGDYEFGRGVRDVALLRWIARVAALTHAPFIAGCAQGTITTRRNHRQTWSVSTH